MRQASRRLTDLLAAWRDADPEQRARLVASLVSEIQVADGRLSAIRPHPAWAPYFEQLLHDGAGDESRTRDLNVGNVALYQLSYSRAATSIIAST
jgi:hypothetical protein